MKKFRSITVAQLDKSFDAVLDVRSPAEFAIDHVPGALSTPVLNDEERAEIGRIYKQISPFEAQKKGAILIARNIARHIEELFLDKPKSWSPLVYCWRGGMRSGAMAHILTQVGWNVGQLEGGYRRYRHSVIETLETLPNLFEFRVVCGPTGSGKSRLLQALADSGAQVLDLEQLAQHRGSLLGQMPNVPQPSQKMFESRISHKLKSLDYSLPVFVESESRKIGQVSVPENLISRMRKSQCIRLETPLEERIKFLMEDYQHFTEDPSRLMDRLSLLTELHSNKVIETWRLMAERGDWTLLVEDLLKRHYDPTYRHSNDALYKETPAAKIVQAEKLDLVNLRLLAKQLIQLPAP